ncbi:MAG TPA: helix-turn-helix domain-containing protein [Candidatus Ruthenibacterium merdavium]|uniref:Helix-turn-helix domain-containing protein n=1 Tax=Candidatus Ruthenibacterium merdavium TaxID=2838752 RepID=A0A9D2Q5D5_9FIRM|nr:helix-turn-helix domain-containing protein [Candidatus Ruthenibacterium merdavium]
MSRITIALGKKIRSLRLSRGWTQEQLAEYADLHVSYIVLLEKGANRATIETLEKLAKAFGISISELVHSLDETNDDPMKKQMRDLMEDFVQKIDAIYKQ